MGLIDLMNIGVSAIRAQQTAIEVTANNIANINTEGFARTTPEFATAIPKFTGGLLRGAGVNVGMIRRAEDRFVNRNIFLGQMETGYYSSHARGMGELEDVVNESAEDTGISAALDDFWAAWSDVANNAEGSAERTTLVGMTRVVLSRFHTTYDHLNMVQRNMNLEVKAQVSDINNIIRQLAANNAEIAGIENAGGDAADFRTTRTVLLNQLAKKLDFSYFEDEDGNLSVNTANGRSLIEGGAYATLEARANPLNNNLYDVIAISSTGVEADITNVLTGGELAGIIRVRDVEVEDARDGLDEIAFALVNAVNAQHALGTTLNGTTGVDFFAPLATADRAAELIEIDPAILADTNNIAAGLSADPGDNRNANLIAQVRDLEVLAGGTATIQEQYATMIGDLGIRAQNAARQLDQSEAIVTQLNNYRESLVGVSVEDEMANLTKYQQAFQAAARILNAATAVAEILNELRQA
jgi:flagellar hook-associated protein 1 FlgK